jgi:hypothetical protein
MGALSAMTRSSAPFRSFARQERDEIEHAFKERIFIDLHRAAALPRDLDEPVEIGWFVPFAFGEDRVFSRESADEALITDLNSHRITLRLPFKAHMPGDVFPSSGKPRLAAGHSQPAPIENAHRDRNRGNESFPQHAFHSARPLEHIQPFGEGLVKPGRGGAYNRAWSTPRLDRQGQVGRGPIDARLRDEQVRPNLFLPLAQSLAYIEDSRSLLNAASVANIRTERGFWPNGSRRLALVIEVISPAETTS